MRSRQKRWPLVVLAVIGVGMMLAPVAFGMFTKAPKGASMMRSFTPFMTTPRLDGFQSDLHYIGAAVDQGQGAITWLQTGHSTHAVGVLAPQFAAFTSQWRDVDADMGGMLTTIQANLPNYLAMKALPSFVLFPWFFFIPGALLLLAALLALRRRATWRWSRWLAVVIGVALIVAPLDWQMFARAPKGAQMMGTFKTIETYPHLHHLQDYFGDMAGGQGLVQLQLVPALHQAGLSTAQIDARYPALNRLDGEWIHILNDMTPMLAAMSNNIVNYQAISSLPSFRLFPWFFLLPGVIVIVLALLADWPPRRRAGVRAGALNPLNQGVT